MIYLADDNPADTLDIGIVSAFTDAVRYQHTGLVRDASDGIWKLFANVVAEPTTTVDFTNATYANLKIGNLVATDISGQAGRLTSLGVGVAGSGAAGSIFTQTLTVGSGVAGDVLILGSSGKINIGSTNITVIGYASRSIALKNNSDKGLTVDATTGNVSFDSDISAGNISASGSLTVSGNITVSSNVVFSGWSIRETGNKLYFAYNGVNKMSLDTGGNLVVTGDVTAFGTIT
jgi:hypothetical protein